MISSFQHVHVTLSAAELAGRFMKTDQVLMSALTDEIKQEKTLYFTQKQGKESSLKTQPGKKV